MPVFRGVMVGVSLVLAQTQTLKLEQHDVKQTDTTHLGVVSYASDEVITPGTRFSLFLDVMPKPGLHVYAPGDHSYRVIRFWLDEPEFLLSYGVTYPPSEQYYFEPLDETVPVYQAPFQLIQEVTVPVGQASAEMDGVLTINGTLEYQACDDEVCYFPVEVPLSWEVSLKTMVQNR